MKLFMILSLLALSACSANQHIDPEFKPYLAQFKSESFTAGNPVFITLLTVKMDQSMSSSTSSSSTQETLVTCVVTPTITTTTGSKTVTTGGPEVRVNPDFWNNQSYSNAAREQALFRELARCTLGLTHDDSMVTTTDGVTQVEKTILNSHYLSDAKYKVNYRYYMKQLFNPSNLDVALPVQTGTSQWVDVYATSTTPAGSGSIEGLLAPLDN